MRKFKHKSSGNIAIETTSEKNYKVSEPQNYTIPKWIVENSNDWEEIKEFPKIISFRNNSNDVIFKICKDGMFSCMNLENGLFNERDLKSHEIYQVQTSETEIFTVGDKVKFYDNISILEKIYFNEHNQLSFKVSHPEAPRVGVFDTSRLEKVSELLFITEDSIEMFEGDDYIAIDPKDFSLVLSIADEGSLESNWLKFSTEETAEKYIEQNKPKFSIKQIEELTEDLKKHCFKYWDDIIKQKLGI
jgi:hypothetical protein